MKTELPKTVDSAVKPDAASLWKVKIFRLQKGPKGLFCSLKIGIR